MSVVASGETTDGRVRLERVSGRRPERPRRRRRRRGDARDPVPRSVAGSIPGSPTLDAVPWDFIVGSDLVYDDECGVRMLPRVIRSLLENAAAARAMTDLDPGGVPPSACTIAT